MVTDVTFGSGGGDPTGGTQQVFVLGTPAEVGTGGGVFSENGAPGSEYSGSGKFKSLNATATIKHDGTTISAGTTSVSQIIITPVVDGVAQGNSLSFPVEFAPGEEGTTKTIPSSITIDKSFSTSASVNALIVKDSVALGTVEARGNLLTD